MFSVNNFRQSLGDKLEILRERQIRSIIDYLGRGDKIMPAIDTEIGMVYYSINDIKIDALTVSKLASSGIIKDSGSSSLATCPVCGNLELNVELVCPTHRVPLQKEEIFEENRTGFIGTIDKFISKDSSTLISPVDKKEISRTSLMKRSYWFRCSVGEEVVNNPTIILHCTRGHDFELVQANIVEIHRFMPDESTLKYAIDYLKFLNYINGIMLERGYEESENKLKGSSGVTYVLDAVYKKGSDLVALSIISEGSIANVLSILPEIYDLKQASTIDYNVIFIPPVGPDVTSVLSRYGVNVITAKNFEGAIESLKQIITQ